MTTAASRRPLTASPAASAGPPGFIVGAGHSFPVTELLDDAEIDARLPDGWTREGEEIVRTFEFDSYLEGVGFAAAAGVVAQDAFHHPEMTIGWREVEVRLTTHDAGGITDNDTDLAARFNDLLD